MAIRLYFPTVCENEKILWRIALKKGKNPGIYPEKLKENINNSDDYFRQNLLNIAKTIPIELTARGYTLDKIKIEGDSATGCLSFFSEYNIEDSEQELDIAISISADISIDSVDNKIHTEAKPISDIKEKLSLCIDQNIHIFILPNKIKNDFDTKISPEFFENYKSKFEEYNIDDDIKYLFEERNKDKQCEQESQKLRILWVGKDWESKLANFLGLKPRKKEQTDHSRNEQEMLLYDLYIAALTSDQDERNLLRDIFRSGGKELGNIPMSENTFPWTIMHDNEGEEQLQHVVFNAPSLIFTGPTSTGKTTLAKAMMLHALAETKQTVYIAPTRALVYEVYNDFCNMLKQMRKQAEALDKKNETEKYTNLLSGFIADTSKILLSTGEKNENDGQILRNDYLIMLSVYEKANLFMNIMSLQREGRRPDLIIIDELHMICHDERGGIVDLFLAKALTMAQDIQFVGITTEREGGETIEQFFKYQKKPTIVISIDQRPLSVRHYLMVADKHAQIAEIIDRNFQIKSTDMRRIRKELQSANNATFDCTVMLKSIDPKTKKPHEKVIGVFNSISRIYTEVKKLSEQRSNDGRLYCGKETLDNLEIALNDSFINEEEKRLLLDGIKTGIFVYYSPLDYKLREAMAKAFQKESKDIKDTQVLLTTDALAYGVNFPADAIYLTYIRENEKADYINRNLFFNILGRAGRLGKSSKESTCSAFIILTEEGIPLERDIKYILSMYNQKDSFKAKTMCKDDIKGILDTDTIRELDDLSFTTFRSSLDALRFIAPIEKNKRAQVKDVRAHIEKSLYGWQFCANSNCDESRENMENFLSEVYKIICEANAFKDNKLLEYNNKENSYSCTELASALIDTGTSWKAIEPMAQWLERIRSFTSLPVELLLVGMLPVQELWESIRAFDTQSKTSDVQMTPLDSNERAEKALRDELAYILAQSTNGCDDASKIIETISAYVEQSCDDLVLSSKHRHPLDHFTRLNSFFRLLAALFAWARGANADEIQKFTSPARDRKDFSISFSPRYGERVYWLCLLCLHFFSKTHATRLRPEHEGALQTLAMRMRYGVPEDCIPLMGSGTNQHNRTNILRYRNIYGITLQTVVQKSFADYKLLHSEKSLSEDEYNNIKQNTKHYYCKAALNFCEFLMRGNISEDIKNSLKNIQNIFDSYEKEMKYENILNLIIELYNIAKKEGFRAKISNHSELIIEEKNGNSSWELVIFLIDPSDTLEIRKNELVNEIKKASEEQNFEKANKLKKEKNKLEFTKSASEIISEINKSREIKEGICVWLPWKDRYDLSDPQLPTLNLMSMILLLRKLKDIGLGNIHRWIQQQKRAGKNHFRIQQLVSDSEEAIEDLRASLPGDLLQGVLQMEEPVFTTSCN